MGVSKFGLWIVLVSWLGCMGLPFWCVIASGEEPLPNIVLIYTDDQGYGDVSRLNREAKFETPHLDRIAREGISFTNGHSSDTVCTPSRYGLLTGRYCWRTRRKRGVLGAEARCLITDGRETLATLLKTRGYQTAMVGKWHLGMDFPGNKGERDWTQPVRDMPLDKGFDYFYGIPASLNYGVLAWFEGRFAKVPPKRFTAKKPNLRHVDYRIMPPYQDSPEATRKELGKRGMEVAEDFVDNQCLTRFTDKAIEWMQGRAAQAKGGVPFFLYLPLTSPHYPVCPLPEFQGQGQCGAYGEFVIETDFHVGRILDFLDKSDLSQNTMVIFTSDNGPEKSFRQRAVQYGHRSNGRFRGGKREIYEGGHRVPFLIRWPKGIAQPGREWDGVVGQVDIFATIAELVGVKPPANAGEDSQSFLDVLQNADSSHHRLPLIHHGVAGRFAVTDGSWKLVMPHGKLPTELYQLDRDPQEQKNLARQNRNKVDELTERITDIVRNGRTTPGEAVKNDTGYWEDLTWMTQEEYTSKK